MAETINKAIKAIKAHANQNDKYYFFVHQKYYSNEYSNTHKQEPDLHFEAYIEGYDIIASSKDIKGLIAAFEAKKAERANPPVVTADTAKIPNDDDLPF